MRRIGTSCVTVVSCCMTMTLVGSETFGREDIRASMFRQLTSEEPASAPAQTASTEPVPAATAQGPLMTPQTPTAATSQASSRAATHVTSPATAHPVRQASFYGGNSARQTMGQFPRRAAIRSNPQRVARRHPKPFETAEHEPTISPYLNLDRGGDDSQDVPSYLTLVMPQFEQMQMNRAQQREIQQLRGQVQTMSTNVGAAPAQDTGRSAGMGASARFMDTAQFYGGMR